MFGGGGDLSAKYIPLFKALTCFYCKFFRPGNQIIFTKDASQDPSIACPVPLRLSPDSPVLETSEDERTPQTIGRQPLSKVKYECLVRYVLV